MMKRWMYSESARLGLRKACMFMAGAVVLASAWFLFNLQQALAAKGEAEVMIKGQKTRMADLKKIVAEGEHLGPQTMPTGSGSVSLFQAYVEQTAVSRDCTVDEFIASQDVGTYLSRFEKDTTETAWVQVLVKTRIQGKASDVVAVLDSLKDSGVTFEFCTLEIVRQSVINDKETKVAALVELNVLIQPEGGTS